MCVCACVWLCVRKAGVNLLGAGWGWLFPRAFHENCCLALPQMCGAPMGIKGAFHPRHPKGTRLGKTELQR